MPLPFTLTRLSQSLSLIAMHQTGDTGLPLDLNANDLQNAINDPLSTALNFADWATSIRPIGATWGFRVHQTREHHERRGINSSIEPFAIVPGQQTTTISMERATLYLQDAMGAFSFVPGNLAFQIRPLMIIENIGLPEGPDGDMPDEFKKRMLDLGKGLKFALGETSPIIYLGCWISESEIGYNVKEDDQMVIQNITLNVAKVMQPLSLIPVVGAAAQATLAENFSVTQALGRKI